MADESSRTGSRGRIDVSTPHLARVYDWALGGKDNFTVDREYGAKIVEAFPAYQLAVRNNRDFLARAVTHLAGTGIDQFLDLGSGLPTSPNIHEVARRTRPGSRVVYVDNDPIVAVHNDAILASTEGVVSVSADIRRPDAILGHPAVRSVIDFDKPLGLLLVAVLHNIPDEDDPDRIVAAYREVLAPGSHLVFSQASSEGNAEVIARTKEATDRGAIPITYRSREQITGFFAGLELLEPGVVFVENWRAKVEVQGTGLTGLGGVARKN